MEKSQRKPLGGNRKRAYPFSKAKLNKEKYQPNLDTLFNEDAEFLIYPSHEILPEQIAKSDESVKKPIVPDGQPKVTMVGKEAKAIKQSPIFNLHDMAEKILAKVIMIKYNGALFFYTGRTYRCINDGEALLKLVRERVSHDAFACTSVKKFSDLLIFLRADDKLVPSNLEERLNKSKYYVVLQNGILDLKRMGLLSHSPEYLTFYELNAYWEPSSRLPEFQTFLMRVSGGDSEVIQRVKEVVGYLLSPVNEGKYFFVMGTAHNSGKSTLGELVKRILGEEYVISRSTNQIGGRFSLGDIQGKMLNMSLDLPKGKLNTLTVSLIKQITGGDLISTEQKYEKIKEIRTNMRFLFGSNFPVTLPKEDDDDAFWERMIIIPFLYSIDKGEADPNILSKLMQEKDGIVTQCLLAFNEILTRCCIFSQCKAADLMKFNWRYRNFDHTGTIEKFINEFIKVTGNHKDYIFSQELYQQYKEYCEEHGNDMVNYSEFLPWIRSNLEGCQRKRVHQTGHNPRSAITGVQLKRGEKL